MAAHNYWVEADSQSDYDVFVPASQEGRALRGIRLRPHKDPQPAVLLELQDGKPLPPGGQLVHVSTRKDQTGYDIRPLDTNHDGPP